MPATVVTGDTVLKEGMMEDMLIKIMITDTITVDGTGAEMIVTVAIGAAGQMMEATVVTGEASQTKATDITRVTGVVNQTITTITRAVGVITRIITMEVGNLITVVSNQAIKTTVVATGAARIMATRVAANLATTMTVATVAADANLPLTVAALVEGDKQNTLIIM